MADSSSLVREAQAAHARGWALTPVRGKTPTLRGWTELAAPTLEEIERWAATGNLGVRTGQISGVVVIDDDSDDGEGARGLDLPSTVTAITGGGGRHFYFRSLDEPVANSSGLLAPSVDVRGDGGQAVLPGSIHLETGEPYHWAPGLSPDEVELAELPGNVLARLRRRTAQQDRGPAPRPQDGDRLTRYARGALRRSIEEVQGAQNGTRNDTLNRCAFAMGRFIGAGLLAEVEVEAGLQDAASATGLNGAEIRKTLRSGIDAGKSDPFEAAEMAERLNGGANGVDQSGPGPGPAQPQGLPCTDLGNAERLVKRNGQDIRFCDPWRKWLAWDGTRWRADNTGAVMRFAKKTVRSIREEAARCENQEVREALWDFARKSEKAERLAAMVKLTTSEEGIPILPDELDNHPMLLNCRNGIVDLETGHLRQHDRDLYLSKLVRVSFDADAQCPRWNAFLNRVLPDAEVRFHVQKAAGYSLTGSVAEQVLFFLHGLGQNGKSIFLRLVQMLLGAYAIQIGSEVLLAKNQDAHPTERADLFGVRFAAGTEIDQGRRFNEALVKQLTGGDRIRARRMKEDFWEFDPTHKLWIAANHKPPVRGSDFAMWRRIHLIPFTVTIPNEERDPELDLKLAAELPGILAWAVQGCLAWQREGLKPPAAVQAAVEEYRAENDVVGRFLEEACVPGPGKKVGATDLFTAFQAWCAAVGESSPSQHEFGELLTQKGLVRRKSRGRKFYVDVALRPQERGWGTSGDEGDQCSG